MLSLEVDVVLWWYDIEKAIIGRQQWGSGIVFLMSDYENVRRIIKTIDIEYNHNTFAEA